MDKLLQVLADNRDAILLAEMGALIHDLGKLSAEFIADPTEAHSHILKRANLGTDPYVARVEADKVCSYLGKIRYETERQPQLQSQPTLQKRILALVNKAEKEAQTKRWLLADVHKFLDNEFSKDRMLRRLTRHLQQYKQDVEQVESDIPDWETVYKEIVTDEIAQLIDSPIFEAYLKLDLSFVRDVRRLGDFAALHHKTIVCPIPELVKVLRAQDDGVDGFDSWLDKGQVEGQPPQDPSKPFIATAFGYESKIETDKLKKVRYAYADALATVLQAYQAAKAQDASLDPQLWVEWLYGDDDNGLHAKTKEAFLKALGETRRAANDVTLWDHSYSVASLYKSALAKVLVDGWQDPANIKWRILRVNLDELVLYAKAHKIADLLAYRRLRNEALDAVRRLIEVEYPLGNEVYRDTSGIYFTFPDVGLPHELRRRIVDVVQKIEPELTPIVAVTTEGKRDELKTLLADEQKAARESLKHPVNQNNAYPCWQHLWDSLPRGKFDVCPVCQLRPKRERDDECEYCRRRRESRVGAWLKEPQSTIWIDEVADHNGQVAVLVGRFDLTRWLNGDMIQTMLVNADKKTPKNPSPARIRRVWETTLRFWKETVHDILSDYKYGRETKRAEIRKRRGIIMPPTGLKFGRGKVYDGTVSGKLLSLFSEGLQFRTISNLQLCGVERIADLEGKKFESEEITFVIGGGLDYEDKFGEYHPHIILVTAPDQFMALVPAHDAVEIAQAIYEKYTRQFAKVRNRLPLHLGLVYFKRKMPLYAALNAGRRMLDAAKSDRQVMQTWQVARARELLNHRVLYFDNDAVWKVDEKMGDRNTPDDWYPYWQVIKTGDGRTLDKKHFRVGDEDWVHVSELQKGDKVAVCPSRFSFLFLDTTTRRFEADDDKYALLLDELPWLTRTWKKFERKIKQGNLSITQLHALERLLGGKWKLWRLGDKDSMEPALYAERLKTFKHLAEAALKDVKILKGEHSDGVVMVNDVISERFFRLLELYLHIMKMGK